MFLREQPGSKNWTALPKHAEDGESSSTLGRRALIVGHPGEGEGYCWEDTGAHKEGGKVSNAGGVYSCQQHVSDTSRKAEKDDENAPSSELIRDEACRKTRDVGCKIRASREPLCVQRRVAHGGENRREVSWKRSECGVEAKDDGGLQVILVVVESCKHLLEVEFAFLLLATALYGTLADDLILPSSEESTL